MNKPRYAVYFHKTPMIQRQTISDHTWFRIKAQTLQIEGKYDRLDEAARSWLDLPIPREYDLSLRKTKL